MNRQFVSIVSTDTCTVHDVVHGPRILNAQLARHGRPLSIRAESINVNSEDRHLLDTCLDSAFRDPFIDPFTSANRFPPRGDLGPRGPRRGRSVPALQTWD